MITRLLAASVFLLGAGSLDAQVIFSRRVYAEHGRTYQQIWEWRASDGGLKALTHSPRNHFLPLSSRDGKRIYFSGRPGRLGDYERVELRSWRRSRKRDSARPRLRIGRRRWQRRSAGFDGAGRSFGRAKSFESQLKVWCSWGYCLWCGGLLRMAPAWRFDACNVDAEYTMHYGKRVVQ